MDLTALSVEQNWTSRFPPLLMSLVTNDGKVVGVPDRYKSWGIWFKKKFFAENSIVVPTDWTEFLAVCQKIKGLGKVPIGIGAQDLWQFQIWWSWVALRLGGSTWYNQLQTGQINFNNDTIHRQTFDILDNLLQFFPPLNTTANYAMGDVVLKWATSDD
jgi:multiple sugar transport system substrate-binding protein